MDTTQYKNKDGTFTSPKNGKVYKSEKALKAHLSFRKASRYVGFTAISGKKVVCPHCNELVGYSRSKEHIRTCYLNPMNTKLCQVCQTPIKNYRASKGTCSRRCANTFFKSGENNGNWRQEAYRTTCFLHHEKKCVICNEHLIVDVHHLDEDKLNNDPSNLIPLCPTHHHYWHSRHKHLIQEKVNNYIRQWLNQQ